MARLVVVGLPGVGKSTLVRALGTYWNCDAVDTDDVVSRNVGVPVPQYLRENGEAKFRESELVALRSVLSTDAVVATGAGVVVTSEARKLLGQELTIWLDSDDATLLERVKGGDRPLLGQDHSRTISTLRREREVWYRTSARCRLDASGSVEEVIERVLNCVEGLRA